MSSAQRAVERRSERRVEASFTVHCRRRARSGVDDDVEVIDMSMGGIRIMAPTGLDTGDVVELTVGEIPDRLSLSGLVVATSRDGGGARYAHIAFTRLVPTALEAIGRLVDRHTA